MCAPEVEVPGTDLFTVKELAELIVRPMFPTRRNIREWTSLTREVLDAPSVWKAVERCAAVLLKQRTIADPDQIDALFKDILNLARHLPRWKRWL